MNYKIESVPVAKLKVDPAYQRELKPGHVDRIQTNFDERAFGPLVVSKQNGHYSVLDGQHRLEVVLRRHDPEVTCIVFEGLTQEDEAKLFLLLNTQVVVHTADKMRARAEAGDPVALDITKTLGRRGLKISPTGRGIPNGVQAVNALEQAQNHRNLEKVVDILFRAWGAEGFRLPIIRGLDALLANFPSMDADQLVERLSRTTPRVLTMRAKGKQETMWIYGGLASHVAKEMLVAYNAGSTGKVQKGRFNPLIFRTKLGQTGKPANSRRTKAREGK